MIYTDRIKHDGYFEILASFSTATPAFRLRAVIQSKGKYKPILRHYVSEIQCGEECTKTFDNYDDALIQAKIILRDFLITEIVTMSNELVEWESNHT